MVLMAAPEKNNSSALFAHRHSATRTVTCSAEPKPRPEKPATPQTMEVGVGEVGAGEGVEAGVVMDAVGGTILAMEINPGRVATLLTQL